MNLNFDKPPQEVLTEFKKLKKGLIDASSVIYARKAGVLDLLQANLELVTTADVVSEAGTDAEGIKLIHCKAKARSVDERLVCCALRNKLPVISEDKKILTKLKQTHLPYYNMLMMLNFLSYKNAIDGDQYSHFHGLLQKIAWYGPKIWDYGSCVRNAIEKSK
jgi:hypothetical protein